MTISEAGFWTGLEYRICSELAGMPNVELNTLWCDGFMPEQYLLDHPEPRILGRAYIMESQLAKPRPEVVMLPRLAKRTSRRRPRPHKHLPKQRNCIWAFTLLLNRRVTSKDRIRWESLLPPYNATRWLVVDLEKETILMDPSAAVPDPTSVADRDFRWMRILTRRRRL